MTPTTPGDQASSEMWRVAQNCLALCSLIISVLALVLSRKRFKHDTRPALILRCAPGGVEIENVGPVAAVGLALNLVERVKRPSAKLIPHAGEVLRPGESSVIVAQNWPKTLEPEVPPSRMDDIVRKLDGQAVRIDPRKVASFVLTRQGSQILILRFLAGDTTKVHARFFSPVSVAGQASIQFKRCRNALWAALLEKRCAKNAEYAPPSVLCTSDEAASAE